MTPPVVTLPPLAAPIDVRHEHRRALVPRPSLLGAIVAKGAACALPGDPSRHLAREAHGEAAVDPFAMREQMTRTDERRVRAGSALATEDHAAWRLVPEAIRQHGVDAYAILTR